MSAHDACTVHTSQRVTRWDEKRSAHLARSSDRVEKWNAIVCQTPADRTTECTGTSVSHSWAPRELHSWLVPCFRGFFSPLHSSLSPFRVPAPADTAICSQVLTVVGFDCTILALFKATFLFVATDNHLIWFDSLICLKQTQVKQPICDTKKI